MVKKIKILIFLILTSILFYSFANAEKQLTKEDIIKIQQVLKDSGYDVGIVDGIMGRKTRDAIRLYQKDKGLEPTGKFTEETLKLLFAPPDVEEPDIEEKDGPINRSLIFAITVVLLLGLFILIDQVMLAKKVNINRDLKKVLLKAEKALNKGQLDKAQKNYEKVIKALD